MGNWFRLSCFLNFFKKKNISKVSSIITAGKKIPTGSLMNNHLNCFMEVTALNPRTYCWAGLIRMARSEFRLPSELAGFRRLQDSQIPAGGGKTPLLQGASLLSASWSVGGSCAPQLAPKVTQCVTQI